jgi:hypothetical protein
MAPRILRDLPLEILVEGFLAADKASAIVLRAELFDTGRRRLRRRHLQCHRFLIAARGGPQSIVDRRRIKQAFAPPLRQVVRAIVNHVTALAQALEIALPVVARIVIEMCSGEDHAGLSLLCRLHEVGPAGGPAAAIAPTMTGSIKPTTIGQAANRHAAGAPTSLPASAHVSKACTSPWRCAPRPSEVLVREVPPRSPSFNVPNFGVVSNLSNEFQRREAGNHRFGCRRHPSRVEFVAIDAEKTRQWRSLARGSGECGFMSSRRAES